MSGQRVLSIREAITIREGGEVEFITHDDVIEPDRHRFADRGELSAYLGQEFGGRSEGDGVRGALTRKGVYSRRAAGGARAVTFGDPVLDAISSLGGELVIGGQTIDLSSGHQSLGGTRVSSGGAAVLDASDLKFTGMMNGAERWASDDMSLVEYRMGTGRLDFHAWRHTEYVEYWSLGGEISVIETNANFQAAAIESHYYMSATGPCQQVGNWQPVEHFNDTYFDRYEWGIHSPEPDRVAVGCRAIWHHQFFADRLTAGDGCTNWPNDPFQQGPPPDWATIKTLVELNGLWTDGARNAAVSTQFTSISVDMSAFSRPTANGSIVNASTIKVKFPDDATYTGTLQAPNQIVWSNGSVWTKVIDTVIDLNGSWTDGGPRIAVISEKVGALTIDMSDFDRSQADGSIVNASTIKVKFPDDATYTGTVQAPNKIIWSNGSSWTKV